MDRFALTILVQILNRFRWVYCQLEILRDCFPPSVRRTLDELPESLDETYERVLKEIKKPNRDHARRLLSCLVAAVRPLRVEELAEVLAVDYEDKEGIPRLNPNWRWEDEEQALLTSCSSLIAIVKYGLTRVVQFSHFSVKEYLTSARLATSSGDVLRYYVALEPAHTILAQACMSALLWSDDSAEQNGVEYLSQLIEYAAEHWVTHAKYGNASSCLRKAMEYLFDPNKPFFAAWRQLHDIDTSPSEDATFFFFTFLRRSKAVPLYYAALCGFQDLVELLILKYPQHVDIHGGYYVTPLIAALAGKHFQIAKILRDNGAGPPNIRGYSDMSPLHSAAYYGDLQMVQVLLDYKADIDAQDDTGETPLHGLSWNRGGGRQISQLHKVSRLLLEHGANVNARSHNLSIPLHIAAQNGRVEVVRVLLEHGTDANAPNKTQSTPLHVAAQQGEVEVVRVLLEHGANVNALGQDQSTPLHTATEYRRVDVVRVLLKYGADVNARNKAHCTPLHVAAQKGKVEVVRVLLEHNADVNARSKDHSTPLHMAPQYGSVEPVRVLLEHRADVDAFDDDQSTPLHIAAKYGMVEAIRVLLEHEADVNAHNKDHSTPLHMVSQYGSVDPVRVLLEHGANVNAPDQDQSTPLHVATDSKYGKVEMVRVLLEYGADVNARNKAHCTPLHGAAQKGKVEVVRVLLEHGASVGEEDNEGITPFQLASSYEYSDIIKLLSEHGAK